jgi:amino acid adenylation domain-containing protein
MPLTVLQLFERWASASPNAVAVVCDGRRLTYGQLNTVAERIADGLRQAGISPGCLVGVLLDRSPEMLAALLGVWKAASAWIPIDPEAPAERIAFMLEDAAPRFLLTRKKFSTQKSVSQVLYIEDLCARKRLSDLSRNPVSPDDLAYVIYTSGSTGKPKGAKITHGGLANSIQGVADDLKATQDDVVLAWSTIAFDVACLEMYLPLAVGASLYLTKIDAAREGGQSPEVIRRSGATVVFGTPTMYRLLIERGWRGDPKMQLAVGGEALPVGLARTLATTCRSLWNQYGPTEATILATRAKIEADVEKITIGQPLPNVRLHLLDQNLQPVPKGSIGELYIAGAGVGLGYLNRPDLSRTHFLPDPFAGGAEGALYKTGDLAVQLDNGDFEFLGRVDHQVKIRGYRIELGEIEAALAGCEGVEAAVVRAIELEPGDRRLIAFVIGDETSQSRWKESLQQKLPEYMLPSEFILMRSFPISATGKVDLRALDAIRLSRIEAPGTQATSAEGIDPIEARLKTIWERVLKVHPVGLDDDFFALGGHSLLAARMLTQVEQWFGSRLPHSVLVENPTIYRLAAHLRQDPAEKWPAVVTIQSGAFLPPLFVAHGIGGSLLSFVDLAAEMGPQQTVYGLQLPAFIEPDQAGIRMVAANFVKQVRALQPRGPYHFAGHSSGGVIVFEMACQLAEQGETVGMLALLDCDPNTGKQVHRAFRDWNSLKASLGRAYAELKVREFGFVEQLDRRISYQKFKFSIWLAARSRRSGRAWMGLGAEGYLALALKEYEPSSYPGEATLFVAKDEPGRSAEPGSVWEGKILGECDVRFVPGTHRTLLMRPQVAKLAHEINRTLARSTDEASAMV